MKKSVVMCLAIIMCMFAVTGSIAYFTDSIQVQGEVKSGNLDIEQFELERVPNITNSLRKYTQNQAIYPSVGTASHPELATEYSYEITNKNSEAVTGTLSAKLMNSSLHGFVDKIVLVKNNGSLPCYVRTFVAVPTAFVDAIHLDWNLDKAENPTGWVRSEPFTTTITYNQDNHQINGVDYTIWYATYNTKVDSNNSAPPSLLGFYLDSQVNHDGTNYTLNGKTLGSGSELKILVASVASQVIPTGIGDESHADANTSMNDTYKEPSASNHPWSSQTH